MTGISLGIASFHFTRPMESLLLEPWIKEVKEKLEAIPSVRDVEIDVPESAFEYWVPERAQVFKSPHIDRGTLSFRITVPKRMQDEIYTAASRRTKTESFAVVTMFSADYPVTFVTPQGIGHDSDGATAVIVVREFLKREFDKVSSISPKLEFFCLGPSPMHVMLSLAPASESENANLEISPLGMISERKPKPGYPSLRVLYDTRKYKDLPAAMHIFFTAAIDQLSFYYYLVAVRNRRMDGTIELSNDTQDLILAHQQAGVRAWLSRVFQSGRLARDLSIAALILQFQFDEQGRHSKSHFDYLVEVTELPVFREFIEKELADDYSEELENCRNVADLLEPRRLREANVVLVIIVAMLSALLGAAAKGIFG